MNFVKIIFDLFLATFVTSEISIKEILNVCKDLKVPLLSSWSLFLGKLLYATDFLRKIRFFRADVQRNVSRVENDIIYVSRPEDSVQGEGAHSDDFVYDSSAVWKSQNPNLSLIVRLFPSPTGFIEPQTSLGVNFGFIMQDNFEKPTVDNLVNGSTTEITSSIDFLAFVLYFNSLTEEDKRSVQIDISLFEEFSKGKESGENFTVTVVKENVSNAVIEKNQDSTVNVKGSSKFTLKTPKKAERRILKDARRSLFDTLYLLFDKRDTTDSSENKKEGIDNLLTKSTIIQAFIAQVMQTEAQYKSFLKSIKKFEDHFQMKIKENFVDKKDSFGNDKLIDTLFKVEEAFLPFPYSKNRQPSQNSNIQLYNSSTGKFFGGRFPNCVESSLYHFLNCLFWNPMKREYEFPAKQKNSDITASSSEEFTIEKEFSIPIEIVNFYTLTGKMRSNLSDEEWKPWHEIVEDLPNGFLLSEYNDVEPYAEFDKLFTYPTYARNPKGHHNELTPGYLSIFVVLATILDKKYLLKGISKSCLDENGILLEIPNPEEKDLSRNSFGVSQIRPKMILKFLSLI